MRKQKKKTTKLNLDKARNKWNLMKFPEDISEVDSWIGCLEELVKTRPELKPELEHFNNFLSGFMRGTLDTMVSLKQINDEVIAGRDDPNDPSTQKILKLDPRFINGFHGIANSEHLNMSEEKFISFVDELKADGQIPSGQWEPNKWGTMSYVFDKKNEND